MTPELKERIDQLVNDNKVLVFMKGSKLMPQCGFSNNVVQILNVLGVAYETVDVLQDFDIRQGIKEYSQWPTIPQVYINGEFIGGSDIMIELYQSGELQQMVEVALAS
jgi:monothiol glutaredoxin